MNKTELIDAVAADSGLAEQLGRVLGTAVAQPVRPERVAREHDRAGGGHGVACARAGRAVEARREAAIITTTAATMST